MIRLLGAATLMLSTLASADEWRGVDLSYINELEDCGAEYRHEGKSVDPYRLLAEQGANLVRLRLWVEPEWTDYSTLEDVKKSIARSKAAGMRVLLDFHYSNDWVHPGKQLRPPQWPAADAVDSLADTLADYTRSTLEELKDEGLFPDIIAVGNEINTDMLIDEEVAEDAPVNWPRNAVLLKHGIAAAKSVSNENGQPAEIMLHIAQPENVQRWFDGAFEHGVDDFDHIGISYYPKWSSVAFSDLEGTLKALARRFDKPVSVVETAYPWTLESNDSAGNLLGEDSLEPGFPATPEGQAGFIRELRQVVRASGGPGVIYWEPAWISSACETRWGKGSHWENATLFDFDGELLPGANALLESSR